MKIGICIPFYNNSSAAKERCMYLLETLKNQNFPELCEIVVVVDGREEEFLKDYDGESGIKVISLVNHQGVSAARNRGIDYLQEKNCKYIGFIDADDSVSGDYIISAYEACEENKYDLLDARFIQGIEVFGTFDDRERQKAIVRNGVVGTFVRSSLIGNIRFDETLIVGEDTDFINKVVDLKKHTKGVFEGMYVYNYGANPDSIIMRAGQNRLTK